MLYWAYLVENQVISMKNNLFRQNGPLHNFMDKFADCFVLSCMWLLLSVPIVTIPVRPGRNLAIILEIAAMNNRQKKMGYNTAEEFNKKLMGQMGL